MVFRHGYDIRQHAMYPGKYYITKDEKQLPYWIPRFRGKRNIQTRMLGLRRAQALIKQLIAKEDRKGTP